MKKIIFLFIFLLSFSKDIFSQYVYEKLFPSVNNSSYEYFPTGNIEADDSSNYSYGRWNNSNYSEFGLFLAKMNELGDTIWTRKYNGSQGGNDFSLIKNEDSSYTAFNTTAGNFNQCDNVDFFLMKLQPNGDTVWTKHYGTCNSDYLHQVVKGPNDGYYVYGTETYLQFPYLGAFLLRLNNNGDTIWTRFIRVGEPANIPMMQNHQENYSCAPSPDGGVIITGYNYQSQTDTSSISYIIKLDSTGTIQWKKQITNLRRNQVQHIVATLDGYILDGFCGLGSMIVKIDLNGNLLWVKIYLANNLLINGTKILSDGTLAIIGEEYAGGYYYSGPVRIYLFKSALFKTSSTGDLQWAKSYRLGIHSWPYSFSIAKDKGYLMTTKVDFNDTTFQNYEGILMKVDSLGNGCTDSTININVTDITSQVVLLDTLNPFVSSYPVTIGHTPFTYGSGIQYSTLCSGNVGVEEINRDETEVALFPNPATNEIMLTTNHPIKTIRIYDVLGEEVLKLVRIANSQKAIDISTWNAGVYFVEVETEKGIVRKKVIKSTMY